MARGLLAVEEVVGMLQVVGVPQRHIDAFQRQAEFAIGKKPEKEVDEVTVSSGRGQKSERGFVELTVNTTRTQMDARKAREIGLMLIESAEAAVSDEIFLKLLAKVGLTDIHTQGQILLDLRELRQGTRGLSFPT